MYPSLLICLFICLYQINAQCVCHTSSTSYSCSSSMNTCGEGGCDYIEIGSNDFTISNDCFSSYNNGKIPIINFTKSCSLYLSSNVFSTEGGLEIGDVTITLKIYNVFESFKVLKMKSQNSILSIDYGHIATSCNFELNGGQIQFNSVAIFRDSNITFHGSFLIFKLYTDFYTKSLTVENSNVTFDSTTIRTYINHFTGNSNVYFKNINFQYYGSYYYILFYLYNDCSISFEGKNILPANSYIYLRDSSKAVFEENTLFEGACIQLEQYANNPIEIKKNCSFCMSALKFVTRIYDFQISNEVNIIVQELDIDAIKQDDDGSLGNIQIEMIDMYHESNFTLRHNRTIKKLSATEKSFLNMIDCELIITESINCNTGVFILHNSILKTKNFDGPMYVTDIIYILYLHGKSRIEIDKMNLWSLSQHFYVDSESLIFIKYQEAISNIVFDLGNKERTKQVLDIGFEIPQYGIYSFINLPTTQCIDAIYSSISTTQTTLTTYSSYTNHTFLSNKKVLRICPNEINKEFQCVLKGSVWQYSFQTNDFSFETRNCPCGNDGITECSYLPTTKSLTIPTTSETLLFEGPIEIINFTRNTNTRTLNGTFYNIIMPSSIELKISNETLKKGEPIEYYSTLKCTNDLDYILTNQNTNETITINLNPITSSETSNIYLPFKIFNIEYSNDLKYKSTVINSGNVINKITLITEKGLTTNLHNRVNSIYMRKKGLADQNVNKSCQTIYTNNQGETTCLFNENYWCQVGEYLTPTKTCLKCSSNCESCLNSTYCLKCSEDYMFTDENSCNHLTGNCIYSKGGSCVLCESGYYLNGSKCSKCSDNCLSCNSSTSCFICSNGLINSNNQCDEAINSNFTSNEKILQCDENYYLNENGECEICSKAIEGCLICENESKCTKCSNNYILNSTNQCFSTQCETGYVENECGQCVNEIPNCLKYLKDECVECELNYYVKDGKCEENNIDNCLIYSNYEGCIRCSDNYYLENEKCSGCSDNCKTCVGNSEQCLICYDGTFLDLETHKCKANEEMKDKCELFSAVGNCVKCKEGYYRNGYSCLDCSKECAVCLNNETCLECNDTYFMNYENECQLKSSIIGCSVEISTTEGCTKCQDGYYLYHKECYECSSKCETCSYSSEYCITCSSDKVFMNNECYEISQITKCKEISNNECTKCSFWYSPNEDGTQCEKEIVWWLIAIIVVVLLIIVTAIIICISISINHLFKKRQRKEQEKTICVFEMERSNVHFSNKICEDVYSNVSFINFNEDEPEIPVDQETRSLICIGNKGKTKKKIQITLKEGCDKYSIRTNPQIITLTKGEACEFEIFITPLCTCKFEDILNIVVLDMKKGETLINQMKIIVETELSTKLDYDELKEDKKLGEGSFGIVYLGTFRGNKVAIKKMKQLNNDDDKMKEFEKEVSMLDKFRSEYIIHFYGASFIPTKTCMVTEFAEFGSLQDLMKKRKEEPISMKLRIKVMMDSAKGISYLHSNGILHRDIKPDNILVVSIDDNDNVNAKLTDFGASRNVNMLMTNMTFTKGIGSPAYMAPEILNRKKYKMPSDVYSFAITMYECFGWKDVYPKALFQFAWDVADFVANGERRPKLENISNELNEIISESWKQEPKERIRIEDVARQLQSFYEKKN